MSRLTTAIDFVWEDTAIGRMLGSQSITPEQDLIAELLNDALTAVADGKRTDAIYAIGCLVKEFEARLAATPPDTGDEP